MGIRQKEVLCTYIHSQWYSGMGWSADRTKGTSCVGPSIPSGTGWKVGGYRVWVGLKGHPMSIYSFHWYIGHANGKTIQDIGEFMNQYVSRSSILVHYVVLQVPFCTFRTVFPFALGSRKWKN